MSIRRKGFVAPSGRRFDSEEDYLRSIRGMKAKKGKSKASNPIRQATKKQANQTMKNVNQAIKKKKERKKRVTKGFVDTPLIKRGKDKDLIGDSFAGYSPEENRRLHTTVIEDSSGELLTVSESEEAGKYTPKKTETAIQYLEDANTLQISKTNPNIEQKIIKKKEALKTKKSEKKKEKIEEQIKELEKRNPISVTQISLQKPQGFLLVSDFKTWDSIKDKKEKAKGKREGGKRLNIAQLRLIAEELELSSAGITQPTLEARIRKNLAK